MQQPNPVEVPAGLVESQVRWNGEEGRAWAEALPGQAAEYLARWGLRRDGPALHGAAALVLPVLREADGMPAALKFQLQEEENAGEADALRAWGGRRAVALLDADDTTGTLLLERLDEHRSLGGAAGAVEGVQVIAELLAELTAYPAPPGLRRLGDLADAMLDAVPQLLPGVADPAQRTLLWRCASALREVADEPGDRLLHWDLHGENILAPRKDSPRAADRREGRGRTASEGEATPSGRAEQWVAIDPKPLAGDPGFDLFPALWNRFRADEVLRRFDLMTEVMDLDRRRAAGWTLGRVMQGSLWEPARGEARMPDTHAVIAEALLTLRT
ncbi:aminoglycoside phosphotransferase family protein [Streptomyces candidus]|uniref:Streptomycin 6-kinase n=1 Tax=Streptomyces candidus TaxID=67283 RepID=A0A7X0HG30_9ACTN|nr:aminoglycoside phosphotransferase family protein [Streptomyces candidus]MBB6435667.1 streptomycin 6-kinase [Streptomyces candidus]GHH46599.1 hydroxyurea phosphotransferase [Streptomyces candidus]